MRYYFYKLLGRVNLYIMSDKYFKEGEIEQKLESVGLDKTAIEIWLSDIGKTVIDTDTLMEMKELIPEEDYKMEFDL